MLLNDEHGIAVFTQQKCASTGLERHLLRQPGWRLQLPRHVPPREDFAEAVVEAYPHRLLQVRHPVDRLWSLYRWCLKRRVSQDYLWHVVETPADFWTEWHADWTVGKLAAFTLTQSAYYDCVQGTGFAKVEEGGLVPYLREHHGLDYGEQPVVNANRTHTDVPEVGEATKHIIRQLASEDARRFGYEQ